MSAALLLPPNLWSFFLDLALDSRDFPTSAAGRDRLMKTAADEGLLALMLSDPHVPEEVRRWRSSLLALRSLMQARYTLHLQAARTFAALVPDAVFFKGFEYRHRLYPSPDLRPAQDIDVFVPARAFKKALSDLAAAGYPRVFSGGFSSLSTSYYEAGVDIGEVRVELHRSIGHRVRASIDYDQLWDRRERFEVAGTTFFRPRPADALVIQALNLAKDEMTGMIVRFVDFWIMLRQQPDLLDEAVPIARRWGLARALYASLRLVSSMFPDLRTATVISAEQALLSERERRFLDRYVIPDRSKVLGGHRDGRAMQLWRKFWLTDRVWRRGAFLFQHALSLASAATQWSRHSGDVDEYRRKKGLGERGRPGQREAVQR